MAISAEERKTNKLRGVLSCRDGEHFAVRVITKNGVMTSEQMNAVSNAAKKYGSGKFCFTTRLTVEIMDVPYQNVTPILADLAEAGLETGGTGALVRPVAACKGTYCVFGLADTQEMGLTVHERFYKGYRNVALPHKFKIAVGGCPNNCVKPDLNDVGLVGARMPSVNKDVCRGCKKCAVEAVCHPKAAKLVDGKMTIDNETCVKCGKCTVACPFKAIEKRQEGFRIYLGGRWGKASRKGDLLDGIYSRDEALDMIEKAMLFFKKTAYAGERFGAMIDRVGIDVVKCALNGNGLLNEKSDILAMPVKAKC